ncbi:MAG TPA: hypothetical protein EYP28_01080 [Methanophagales archaeon]|nr:hypothetical protein [Methanophagales archaeon]
MLRVLKTDKPANWGAKKDEKEWALAMEEDEFSEGFDVHLFSHVLHDWDFSDVKLLLENSYRNLNPGGRIMIHDAHINAEKNGPLSVAEYSVLLMFASEGKCYSISEMEYVPTVANRSVIIGEK